MAVAAASTADSASSPRTKLTADAGLAWVNENFRTISDDNYTAAHEFSYYSGRFGWRPDDYPEAHFVSERIVSLPLFPGMSDADQDDAIAAVREVTEELAR